MAKVLVCDRSGSVLGLYLLHVLVTCMHGICQRHDLCQFRPTCNCFIYD